MQANSTAKRNKVELLVGQLVGSQHKHDSRLADKSWGRPCKPTALQVKKRAGFVCESLACDSRLADTGAGHASRPHCRGIKKRERHLVVSHLHMTADTSWGRPCKPSALKRKKQAAIRYELHAYDRRLADTSWGRPCK